MSKGITDRAVPALLFTATLLLLPPGLDAGTYFQVVDRGAFSPGPGELPPFAIMHPLGYDGPGGTLTIKVCVRAGQNYLITPVQESIAVWNALTPTTANCENCFLAGEEAPNGAFDTASVLVHELGHCAFGLDHINLVEGDDPATSERVGSCDVNQNGTCGEATSFTASFNTTRVLDGGSGIRGDADDAPENNCLILESARGLATEYNIASPPPEWKPLEDPACLVGVGCPGGERCCPACPGPECPSLPWQIGDISYFRTADNNPFVIDATVIDKDSYSRNDSNLPPGDSYAASANRAVGEALGLQNSQAVMYSVLAPTTAYLGLVADDVNMVKMAMTGADRDGGTADDYTIQLQYEPNCSAADLEVQRGNEWIATDNLSTLGSCIADTVDSFAQPPQLRFHHTLVAAEPVESRIVIELNPRVAFEFNLLLYSGFETGDLSEWSAVVPSPGSVLHDLD